MGDSVAAHVSRMKPPADPASCGSGEERSWSNYPTLYWSLLNQLMEDVSAHVWGKLVIMEYDRCVLEVKLDVSRCHQVNVYVGDGGESEAVRREAGVANVDLVSCGGGAAASEAVRRALAGSDGRGALHLRHTPHGIFLMSSSTTMGLRVYLCHLQGTPHATSFPLIPNKPIAAFNGALFHNMCAQFHQQLTHYPHVNHATAKLLLQMCVFNVCMAEGTAGTAAVGDLVTGAPLWLCVVNVHALHQVLAEGVVRHLVRQELVRCRYPLLQPQGTHPRPRRLYRGGYHITPHPHATTCRTLQPHITICNTPADNTCSIPDNACSTPDNTTCGTPANTKCSTLANSTCSSPAHTTGNTPSNNICSTHPDTTCSTPANIKYNTPANSTCSTPAKTICSTPANSTCSTPANSTYSTPESSTCSTPANTIYSTPANCTCSTPANTTYSTPANCTCSTPANTTCSTPANTTCSTPANTTCSTPANTTCSTPANSTCSTPANTTCSTPANTTCSTPGNTACSTPANTTCSTPANTICSTPATTTTCSTHANDRSSPHPHTTGSIPVNKPCSTDPATATCSPPATSTCGTAAATRCSTPPATSRRITPTSPTYGSSPAASTYSTPCGNERVCDTGHGTTPQHYIIFPYKAALAPHI